MSAINIPPDNDNSSLNYLASKKKGISPLKFLKALTIRFNFEHKALDELIKIDENENEQLNLNEYLKAEFIILNNKAIMGVKNEK